MTFDDVTIPSGDQVMLLHGSANHDEAVDDDPESLDLDRNVISHAPLTFTALP